MTLPSTTFQERVKTARLLEGLSQVQLAQRMARPHRTICRWENGGTPTPSAAASLARALRVNLLWLLTGEGPKDAPTGKASVPAEAPVSSNPGR